MVHTPGQHFDTLPPSLTTIVSGYDLMDLETILALRVFEGTLNILKVGDNEAEFTEELNDPESSQFKDSAYIVCLAVSVQE